MASITVILSLLVQFVIANDYVPVIEPKIYKGNVAEFKDYPYFAGLVHCGATILNNEWLLTARHCVEYKNCFQYHEFRRYPILIGGERVRNINKVSLIINHVDDDIALMKLSKPLIFSEKIQPVKMPVGEYYQLKHIAIGRGTVKPGPTSSMSKHLNSLNVTKSPTIKCFKNGSHNFIPEKWRNNTNAYLNKFVCVRRSERLSSGKQLAICSGDSGSPLLLNDTLVGVASFVTQYVGSIGKACGEFAGYVKVLPYLPWIEETMEKYKHHSKHPKCG